MNNHGHGRMKHLNSEYQGYIKNESHKNQINFEVEVCTLFLRDINEKKNVRASSVDFPI